MDRTFLKHNRFLGISDRKLVERELAKKRGGAEELVSVRDILYEDRWFRIATAVFTQIKRQFAEGAEAGEVIEAAERRLYGLRLEVVEAPLLKIEAAVEQGGKIAAVRCRAALDLGIETVFTGRHGAGLQAQKDGPGRRRRRGGGRCRA
jgi:nitrogenase molybdenum-iron protein alpha/beta subunit